jgi:biotin carboxyl carrier protein
MKQFSEVRAEAAGVLVSFKIDDFGIVNPGDVIAIVE